jgi:hypothetical protein
MSSDPFIEVEERRRFRWHCTSCDAVSDADYPNAEVAREHGEDHSCLDRLTDPS